MTANSNNTADLLFELGTEELPPTSLSTLSASFTQLFVSGLSELNISHGEVQSFATPRRLGLLIKDCSLSQPDQAIEKRGPAVKAAFDSEGNPSKAAQGFASSCGTSVDKLDRLKTDKGEWLCFNHLQKGKASTELLPEIAQNCLDKLPIPKRMRWGDSDVQFVRPVKWLLFLLGNDIVPCTLLDAVSSNKTFGHRFHHPDSITITDPNEYISVLENIGKVLADFNHRKSIIEQQVESSAQSVQGHAVIDTTLLDEVTGLVEWPVAILGNFDKEFLDVPHEALILTMKKNQKYFPVLDSNNQLINYFITISNISSKNPDTIKAGNERVIRPRLADAKFFWEQDAKLTLEDRLERLKHIIFEKQLGSIFDKSERVSALAVYLSSLLDTDSALAQRAGLLSRCDLVTEMVFEFADMQGVMGRYQAKRDGEDSQIAIAMDEIYMPRFSGDVLPQSKVGIVLAIADRLDTLTGIFGINLKPSGTKDPFALRRAALGLIRIIRGHSLSLNIPQLITFACDLHKESITNKDVIAEVSTYINDRLKGLLIDEGISINLVKSVASVQPTSFTDFDKRIKAVTAFSQLPQAETLSAANKRIHNILKKAKDSIPTNPDSSLFETNEESLLFKIISEKELTLSPLIANSDYEAILISLADLKEPIDSFFDHVMVMAENNKIRLNRLSLLQNVSKLFLKVADVSVLQEN